MAVWSPGVAFEDATEAQPDAFENAPFFDGLDHVAGAGRLEAAGRTEHRRNGDLVKADGEDEYFFEESVHFRGA